MTPHLAISHTVSVQYDPVWEGLVDVMVMAESRGHAELEVVSKLLTSRLEHGLGVVPGGSCDSYHTIEHKVIKIMQKARKDEILFTLG